MENIYTEFHYCWIQEEVSPSLFDEHKSQFHFKHKNMINLNIFQTNNTVTRYSVHCFLLKIFAKMTELTH